MNDHNEQPSPLYMRNPDVVVHEEDRHGALLFNPDNDGIRLLNATGRFIWDLCDGKRDFPQLVSALRRSFSDVPDEEVEGHVSGFLEEMIKSGFIGTMDD